MIKGESFGLCLGRRRQPWSCLLVFFVAVFFLTAEGHRTGLRRWYGVGQRNTKTNGPGRVSWECQRYVDHGSGHRTGHGLDQEDMAGIANIYKTILW